MYVYVYMSISTADCRGITLCFSCGDGRVVGMNE